MWQISQQTSQNSKYKSYDLGTSRQISLRRFIRFWNDSFDETAFTPGAAYLLVSP